MYGGDFQAAIREQRAVLQMSSSYVLAYLGLALSQLAEGRPAEAVETYQKLASVDAWGASAAAVGLADVALYEGHASDAIALLQKAIENDVRNNSDPDSRAIKLVVLAQAQLQAGQPAQAHAATDKAVAASKAVSVLYWAAQVYLATNRDAKALDMAMQLGKRLEPDPQAYSKLVEGEVQLKRGKPRDAIKTFLEARKLADTWLGHFDLGLAYLDADAFADAYSEFEVCVKRRGESTAAFLDEVPTYHIFPPVYYYLGRAQEGLQSPAAAESYKTFLGIKEKGAGDPLVADARRRLGNR
jgi:tetratricopeptide (TPR) repeat protein